VSRQIEHSRHSNAPAARDTLLPTPPRTLRSHSVGARAVASVETGGWPTGSRILAVGQRRAEVRRHRGCSRPDGRRPAVGARGAMLGEHGRTPVRAPNRTCSGHGVRPHTAGRRTARS
jgi:hypothetical protein